MKGFVQKCESEGCSGEAEYFWGFRWAVEKPDSINFKVSYPFPVWGYCERCNNIITKGKHFPGDNSWVQLSKRRFRELEDFYTVKLVIDC
jgi:hypothetical protein